MLDGPPPHAFTHDHWSHLLVADHAARQNRPIAPDALPMEGWRHLSQMRAAGWLRTDPSHLPPSGPVRIRLTRHGQLVATTLKDFLAQCGSIERFHVPPRAFTRTGEREHLEASPHWTLCGRRVDRARTRSREREGVEGPRPYCRSCWLSHGQRLAVIARDSECNLQASA